jgi:ribosomal protein L29
MDAKELRQKTVQELETLVAELRGSLHDAEFRVASRQSGKVRELRTMKRDLARVLTVLAGMKNPTPHV